jgi:hypothetical protein
MQKLTRREMKLVSGGVLDKCNCPYGKLCDNSNGNCYDPDCGFSCETDETCVKGTCTAN